MVRTNGHDLSGVVKKGLKWQADQNKEVAVKCRQLKSWHSLNRNGRGL